jgi:hypothetical protein
MGGKGKTPPTLTTGSTNMRHADDLNRIKLPFGTTLRPCWIPMYHSQGQSGNTTEASKPTACGGEMSVFVYCQPHCALATPCPGRGKRENRAGGYVVSASM